MEKFIHSHCQKLIFQHQLKVIINHANKGTELLIAQEAFLRIGLLELNVIRWKVMLNTACNAMACKVVVGDVAREIYY